MSVALQEQTQPLSYGGGGSGDVAGPASSVDNTLPRFDGLGGKTLQGSGVIVDDGNNVSGVAGLTVTGNITLSTGGATVGGVDLTALASTVSANTSGLNQKANLAWTVRTVTGTTDTIQSLDSNNPVLYTNAGAVAVTVPSTLPLGAYPIFVNGGSSTQLTFAGSGGLTVVPPPGLTLKSRTGAAGAAVCINVLSSTLAILTGDVSST